MRALTLGLLMVAKTALAAPVTPPPPLPMSEDITTMTTTPPQDGPLASKLAVEQRKRENASGWSWAYKLRRFFTN